MKYNWLMLFVLFFFTLCENEKNMVQEVEQGFQKMPDLSFAGQKISAIAIDQAGYKWIGTDSGLFRYDNKNWAAFSALKTVPINALVTNGDLITVASAKGAYSLKIEAGKVNITDTFNANRPGISFDTVNVWNKGLGDRKWFGITQGLAMHDGIKLLNNKNISRNLITISKVCCMAFRENDGFFGTMGSFLFHVTYHPETDAITGASQLLGGADNSLYNYNGELTTDTIFCVSSGSDGSIWFGSLKGLTRNMGETKVGSGIFEYHLKNERVRCVYEFSDGKIWAGSENGFFVNMQAQWIHYTIADGLPGNTIFAMAEDIDGSIWIGTDKGLSHYKNDTFLNNEH